jgi:sulfur relay (sulfurtransferase) complex TusBCD TusD component (DsrE family)
MKLAIQLLTGLDSEDARTARKLAEAALTAGHEVSVFLMDDGVYHSEAFADLGQRGTNLALCAHNAHQRNLPRVEGVLFGGQNDWAEMVADADKVISFG